jgi:hypothetical protein
VRRRVTAARRRAARRRRAGSRLGLLPHGAREHRGLSSTAGRSSPTSCTFDVLPCRASREGRGLLAFATLGDGGDGRSLARIRAHRSRDLALLRLLLYRSPRSVRRALLNGARRDVGVGRAALSCRCLPGALRRPHFRRRWLLLISTAVPRHLQRSSMPSATTRHCGRTGRARAAGGDARVTWLTRCAARLRANCVRAHELPHVRGLPR